MTTVAALCLLLAAPEAEPAPPSTDAPSAPLELSVRQPSVPEPAPMSAAVELERAEALLRVGMYDESALAFGRVVVLEPHHVRAREGVRDAAAALGQVARIPDLTADLVRTYHHHGKRGLALERLRELMAIDPHHPAQAELASLLNLGRAGRVEAVSILDRLRSLFGILVLLGIAFAMSNARRKISWRLVAWGLGLQLIFGLFIMRTDIGAAIFDGARVFVNTILSYTDAGAGFIFGSIYNGVATTGTEGPVMYTDGTSGDLKGFGFIFAFHVVPTIIFFGALMSVLYHLGVVQRVVRGVAWVMQKTMGASGAESLSAAGNIFVGQTEAPLLIRPYVGEMTVSELMAVMVGGFATVAGGVLAAYVRFGLDAGHLLSASVMSAPAALVVAKIMYPELGTSKTSGGTQQKFEKNTTNVIDAAAAGTTDGLKLALNVAAMLLAFMSLVALLNGLLGWAGDLVGIELSLKGIFGVIFAPLSWCMGVASQDILTFGNLLGTKLAINEFVAYVDLGAAKAEMTNRSFIIATYALCGFANFSSIGIQIGGISAIAPERRSDLAKIGLKAMFGGAIASWLTACIAGMLL